MLMVSCESNYQCLKSCMRRGFVGCNTRRALHRLSQTGMTLSADFLDDEWCNAPAGYYTLPKWQLQLRVAAVAVTRSDSCRCFSTPVERAVTAVPGAG
jgi:hypothetical protein